MWILCITSFELNLPCCMLSFGWFPGVWILYADVSEHCLFHVHRQVGARTRTYLPMKMEQTECSETSAYKIQTPGNHPKESIQHSGHGESLKSRINLPSLMCKHPFLWKWQYVFLMLTVAYKFLIFFFLVSPQTRLSNIMLKMEVVCTRSLCTSKLCWILLQRIWTKSYSLIGQINYILCILWLTSLLEVLHIQIILFMSDWNCDSVVHGLCTNWVYIIFH